MLWVGCHGDVARTVRGCMIRHRLFASEIGSEIAGRAPGELSGLCCALDALPLPNNSLDAMVLHHALEVCADARSGLREAARVLVPGGRLVICAFNPMSLWGTRRLYARVTDDAFSGMRWVPALRLLDWLSTLGFERQGAVLHLSYTLPFAETSGGGERLMRRLGPPVGGVYLVSAVKQAAAVRPHWRRSRIKGTQLLPAAYPKSAVNRSPAQVLRLSDWKDLERGR